MWTVAHLHIAINHVPVVLVPAALVIFAPARNRLRALEQAAERLGAGQLDTRAPAQGRDEIARVATAFIV